ncbi:MAG: hypothetical protein HY884_06885 [Deltaproteobacteria bacterium]|nr:hypothetical protein [Deltaproteobacteria bacterium]
MKRGFIPIACNKYAGIAWQGAALKDFWMWNKQFTRGGSGEKLIQAVKAVNLKDAALRYWRDGWVPLKPVSADFLKALEDTLRAHTGLKRQGVKFPDGPFLKPPAAIPVEYLSAQAREYIGMRPMEKHVPA